MYHETVGLLITSETEPNGLPLATAPCHGAGAREGLDIPGLGEAIPMIAELDEREPGAGDTGGGVVAGREQGHGVGLTDHAWIWEEVLTFRLRPEPLAAVGGG
jgi:hypothetical protein